MLKIIEYLMQDYYTDTDSFKIKLKYMGKALLWPSSPAAKICVLIRLGHYFAVRKLKFLRQWCEFGIYKKYNCTISCKINIGKGLFLPHPQGIVIGEECTIGENVTIYQNVTIGRKDEGTCKYPKIMNDVIIYCNSTIIGDVIIGRGSIIGAHSLVLSNVEENSVYVGCPAKMTKGRK
ncbi:serine O-acetyltransferase [Desulfosporosinus shakirovi]|uniref:serine O-acetyltransferase n=1 Tax=Desulfosporosinus shakirovi TaxID=2885154 RepID=UPI001E650B31|nr:serine acetyltransferase [Desulfosporosinus sp. SRJS8]MCB8817596.1 serine acetyltransferase [Desulfosporosinus sp. SRJS8]